MKTYNQFVSETNNDEWKEARAKRIKEIEARVQKMAKDTGWNDTNDVYNRDWKKDLAKTKRHLRDLKAGKGKRADGLDLI